MHADWNGEGEECPSRRKTFLQVRSAGFSPCLLLESKEQIRAEARTTNHIILPATKLECLI